MNEKHKVKQLKLYKKKLHQMTCERMTANLASVMLKTRSRLQRYYLFVKAINEFGRCQRKF